MDLLRFSKVKIVFWKNKIRIHNSINFRLSTGSI
jgi:hypothetical protein